jgi:hypothetical protein
MFRATNIRTSKCCTALWVGLALVLAGCGDADNNPQTIVMRAALTLPVGSNISSLTYAVMSSSGATLQMGTIPISNPNAVLALNLMLPPGTGDILELTATGSGAPCTGKSAPFDVVAGAPTSVGLNLVCGDQPQPASCPEIHAWIVTSDQAAGTGSTISPQVTVTEAGSTEPLAYAWTATAGVFSDSSVGSTTYTCTAPGDQSITLTVTEGTPPTACASTVSFPIDCGASVDAGASPL